MVRCKYCIYIFRQHALRMNVIHEIAIHKGASTVEMKNHINCLLKCLCSQQTLQKLIKQK